MIQEMCDLEKSIQSEIISPSEWDITNGVRGGALMLLVGAFEKYIKDSIKESIQKIKIAEPKILLRNLPKEMQIQNMYNTLNIAINGKSFEKVKKNNVDRFPIIIEAGKIVYKMEINSEAFTDLGSNPNSGKINTMYKHLGLMDIFSVIKDEFSDQYDLVPEKNVSEFIRDKLDGIVIKRHRIAHTANANDITTEDILGYSKFLRTLISSLDKIIIDYIDAVISDAQISLVG